MAWDGPGQVPWKERGLQPHSSVLSRRLMLTWCPHGEGGGGEGVGKRF